MPSARTRFKTSVGVLREGGLGYLRLWLAVSGDVLPLYGPAGRACRVPRQQRCALLFVLSGYVIALVLDGRYRGPHRPLSEAAAPAHLPGYLVVLALTTLAWSVVWFHWHLARGPVAWAQRIRPACWATAGLVLQHFVLLGMEWFSRFNLGSQRRAGLPDDSAGLDPGHGTQLLSSGPLAAARLKDRWLWACGGITLLMKAWSTRLAGLGAPLLPFEMGYFSLGVLGWRWQKGRALHPARLKLGLLLGGAAFLALPYPSARERHRTSAGAPWIAAALGPALPAPRRPGLALGPPGRRSLLRAVPAAPRDRLDAGHGLEGGGALAAARWPWLRRPGWPPPSRFLVAGGKAGDPLARRRLSE